MCWGRSIRGPTRTTPTPCQMLTRVRPSDSWRAAALCQPVRHLGAAARLQNALMNRWRSILSSEGLQPCLTVSEMVSGPKKLEAKAEPSHQPGRQQQFRRTGVHAVPAAVDLSQDCIALGSRGRSQRGPSPVTNPLRPAPLSRRLHGGCGCRQQHHVSRPQAEAGPAG